MKKTPIEMYQNRYLHYQLAVLQCPNIHYNNEQQDNDKK